MMATAADALDVPVASFCAAMVNLDPHFVAAPLAVGTTPGFTPFSITPLPIRSQAHQKPWPAGRPPEPLPRADA